MRPVRNKAYFSRGFTLIELLIVISILGILAVLGISSYVNTLKAGRDAKRKTDLKSIENALELYYEDNKEYPLSLPFGSSLCHPGLLGCNAAKYIDVVPDDLSASIYYYDSSDGSYFKLYSCIENPNDGGPGVKDYLDACNCSGSKPCRFAVSSSNVTP